MTPRVSTAGLDAGERRIAARHLLLSPILTAARQPAELDLVRRHATALKSMFASQLGYALIVESSFARLVKAPLAASAPVRPARRTTDDSPFTPATYVHLSLVCAALLAPGVGEQILISALVDQIRADAAEQAITITDGHQRPPAARHLPQAAGRLGRDRRDRRLAGRAGVSAARTRPCSASTARCSSTCCRARCTTSRRRRTPGRSSSPSLPGAGSGSGWWRTRRCSGPSSRTTSWTCCPGTATSSPGTWTRTSAWCWRSAPKARWPTTRRARSPTWTSPAAAAPSRRPCCCSTS